MVKSGVHLALHTSRTHCCEHPYYFKPRPGDFRVRLQLILSLTLFAATQAASAQAIISPVNAAVTGGGSLGSLAPTYNQSGLYTGFTSGVTDFATYMATNPGHSPFFSGEWASPSGNHDSDVVFDLGSVMGIDKLAFWNEEAGGVGTLNVFGSVDNVSFFALALNLTPTNASQGADYYANVYAFAPTAARYVLLDMHGCPNPNGNWNGCTLGEVAFETAVIESTTPEPASMVLMFTGLAGIGAVVRRRRAA